MGGTLDVILRTFKQAPDANILLTASIASHLTDTSTSLTLFTGLWALKQYVWGHLAYNQTNNYIQRYQSRSEEVNEKAIKRATGTPCYYFGVRYALRENNKANSPSE